MDVKSEDFKDDVTIENKIIELVTEFPQGVSDKVLLANMPTVDPKARAMVINKLLMAEKIDLFNGKDGLLYRRREPSKAGAISGDQEEKGKITPVRCKDPIKWFGVLSPPSLKQSQV